MCPRASCVAWLHRWQPLDLLVIDPLATLWPCRDVRPEGP